MRARWREVWRVQLRCDDCVLDGNLHRLNLTLRRFEQLIARVPLPPRPRRRRPPTPKVPYLSATKTAWAGCFARAAPTASGMCCCTGATRTASSAVSRVSACGSNQRLVRHLAAVVGPLLCGRRPESADLCRLVFFTMKVARGALLNLPLPLPLPLPLGEGRGEGNGHGERRLSSSGVALLAMAVTGKKLGDLSGSIRFRHLRL
jgi:hypothetical protein